MDSCPTRYLCSFGIPNGNELLCDDRQNFYVDSIKFIKAAPGPWLSQTAEEAPHHLKAKQCHSNLCFMFTLCLCLVLCEYWAMLEVGAFI